MLDPSIFLVILAAFAIISVIIGLQAARSVETTTDFYLAGKTLGVVPITLTLLATQIGGGFFTGIGQEAYYTGLFAGAYALGISVGFFMLGLGVAQRLKALNMNTTAQLFETHYNSITLKKIASVLSIISLWGLVVAQMVSLKTVLSGIGITNPWVGIIFWLAIIGYTSVGGFKAAVFVDIFKEAFIIIMFGGIFIYGLLLSPGLQANISTLFANLHLFKSTLHNWQHVLAIFLMPALYCLIEQDLAQCFFAAKNQRTATVSALLAALFLTLFAAAPLYLGMQARILNLPVAYGANPLVLMLDYLCNDVILALAITALIAAISSTAHALLCAVSGNIGQDFDFSFLAGTYSRLTIAKLITVVSGVSALMVSFIIHPDILGILTESYALSVCCLLVPSLSAYFGGSRSTKAAWASVICGLWGLIVFRYIPVGLPKELIALTLSTLGYFLLARR